jgi:hypothetical protein
VSLRSILASLGVWPRLFEAFPASLVVCIHSFLPFRPISRSRVASAPRLSCEPALPRRTWRTRRNRQGVFEPLGRDWSRFEVKPKEFVTEGSQRVSFGTHVWGATHYHGAHDLQEGLMRAARSDPTCHASQEHVTPVMSLASCAFRPWHPDIITAIVNDKNPPQLTLGS